MKVFIILFLILSAPLGAISNSENVESGFRLFDDKQNVEEYRDADARVVFVMPRRDSGMNVKGERRVKKSCEQGVLPGGCVVDENPLYMGVFLSGSETTNELVDIDGFANWGHPGSVSNYDNVEFVGGVLVGKKFTLGRSNLLFRVEIDHTFGDGVWAETSQLDPRHLDETARAEIEWLSTLRIGVERTFGSADVFVFGGLAAAEIINSVTDIDWYRATEGYAAFSKVDLDDSFYDSSVRMGWVIGVGAETEINNAWLLRLDSSYISLGEDTFYVNHSSNNICGPGNMGRPCPYDIKNEMSTVRMMIVRKLRW